MVPLSWCAVRWRLYFRGCQAGPPYSCHSGRESWFQPLLWRNSKKLSRGSRSDRRPARMACPTWRSSSLLQRVPTSSCGCTRLAWRPAFSRPAGRARDSSCSQSQANLPMSRPRIVHCACWTRRA
uniref:Uncharacterized protein n=1 Tax=Trichogramma kaykai TaxID=54128 RepID=A0ABD2W5J6_9HYME